MKPATIRRISVIEQIPALQKVDVQKSIINGLDPNKKVPSKEERRQARKRDKAPPLNSEVGSELKRTTETHVERASDEKTFKSGSFFLRIN